MKFLDPKDVTLDNALRITSDASPRQILRIAVDQYVVIDAEAGKMVTAFESTKFSDLINTLKESIWDIEVIATRPLLSSDVKSSNETAFEIRMFLPKGRGLAFNSSEEAFTFSNSARQSLVEVSSGPVSNYWELPSRLPFTRLLATPEFVQWMNSMDSNCHPSQVLERCFYDFQQRQRNSPILNPGKPIKVEGEFGAFIAIEYLCGRVCLHQTK